MTLGERLKALRVARGLTQNDLVKIMAAQLDADTRRQTIGMWETGKSIPRHETLVWLAQFYKVSLDYLFEGKEGIYESAEIPVVGTIRKLPVLSAENIIDTIEVPANMVRDGTYFQLIVNEDSMTGLGIEQGQRVIVREQTEIEDGQIGLVVLRESVILRRIYNTNGGYLMISSSPKYPEVKATHEEARILGRIRYAIIEY